MFWRFGGYANVSVIDAILDKAEFTIEELLDESDLIQELKQHSTKLLEYLRKREVLEKLLEYAIAPKLGAVAVTDKKDDEGRGKMPSFSFSRPRASSRATDSGSPDDEAEKRRNKYAFVASDILASDNWSISEALMDPQNRDLLRKFWRFLERPSPLDPLQASYFTKVNESLFDKKTEEMVEYLKTMDDAIPNMLRHVDSPMVMDLLLKIISLERTDAGQGIVEWLFTKDVMPSLLSFLGPEHSWATQTSAGDFMKAIITVSANASQNEQTCIGPNELTRQLVSRPCVEQLIGYMLGGGNALTVGVGIVIEVIRKNNSDYDPDVGAEASSMPSSRDPIYLGTLLRLFADNVPNFMNLIMIGEEKPQFESTFGERIQPLGFDRFKTCELMAELLHCSNMGLLNEVGSEELIAARDAERQRLRLQGNLTAVRGEEAPSSGEDLTMRLGSSPPERRLEITNISDDDGFEDVTNSVEMAEDTSHEFVKAEDEISQSLPASSFLDKEDDDFVDEPLSSPRLNISDVKTSEQQFEDPEMVVEPLSPRKAGSVEVPKAADVDEEAIASTSAAHTVTTTIKEIESMVLGADSGADAQSDTSRVQLVDDSSSAAFTPSSSVSEISASATPSEAAADVETPPHSLPDNLQPHAEDVPAGLFTGSEKQTEDATPEHSADDADVSTKTNITGQAPDADAAILQDGGEESIIVGHDGGLPAAAVDDKQIKPVVGDYLKMQFVEYKVVPTILSFFFKYPWNNFLHNVVYDVVQQVFNGPMDRGFNPTLAISLFESADITTQITNGQMASEQSEAKNKTRMGYMGHLTLIAEEVVKFNERHPPELLSDVVLEKVMSPEWSNYVEGPLAETRERDNAILGGVRPDVALSNRAAAQSSGLAAVGLSSLGSTSQGGSSALADAGLNGGLSLSENGGSGLSHFAISAGTMGSLSGFGSSSDEEDDDQEDNDDDVANEQFRAYTDPLNTAGAGPSLNPPSVPPPPPPPPPPLNIPPSRARLQLAARLAMSKRNAAASGDGGQENGTSGDGSRGAMYDDDDSPNQGLLHQLPSNMSLAERLKDPFADDGDEDEEEDEDSAFAPSVGEGRDATAAGVGWNHGNWWRGVMRSGGGAQKTERFGDGRDDSDSDLEEDDDDEEFGDFALPEVGDPPVRASDGPAGKFFDLEREKVLLKPLPVHPPQGSSAGRGVGGVSKLGSLWPFDGLGFGASEGTKEGGASGVEARGVNDEGSKTGGSTAADSSSSSSASAAAATTASSASHKTDGVPGTAEETNVKDQEEPLVVNEDGKPVARAVEAQRRTSIEDPDDDDQVVL